MTSDIEYPSAFDDEYYADLQGESRKKFRKIYRKLYNSINDERARNSYIDSFEAGPEAKYRLFNNIVGAFSSGQAGFEALSVDPLYEFDQRDIEVLLAKPQASSVHLCFVSCGVENYDSSSWAQGVNQAIDILTDPKVLQSVKESIHCSDLDIGSIQYAMITRDKVVPEIDTRVIREKINSEYYAIWKLVRQPEINDDTGEIDEEKIIKFHEGEMSVPSFEDRLRDGIDLLAATNDDMKYSVTTHNVFPLGDVCLRLYLDKVGEEAAPKEFTKDEFKTKYLDCIHFGPGREAMKSIAKDKADELINFGIEYDAISEDSDILKERDYKIMWGSEDWEEIKDMVKRKYIDSKVPIEKGEMVVDDAKELHRKDDTSLDDYL